MFYKLVIFYIVLTLLSCTNTEKSQVSQEQLKELQEYITDNHKSPEDYVVDKFNDHEVVILGEMHRCLHDPIFIQKLIPVLHKNGINYLATEFARREDQPLIDSLLKGDIYNDALAQQITFKQFVHWGYREYVDIYKAAWELNQTLQEDEKPFTILAGNDSPDWSVMQTEGDREIDSLKRLVWQGGGEKYWAETILHQVEQGNKVLVYCGMHHAFSEYLQPIVRNDGKFIRFEENRMGRYLYNELDKNVITVFMHGIWLGKGGYNSGRVRPVDGIIDLVMESLDDEFKPVGFDIKDSPFGKLEAQNAVYAHGYDPFTLEKYCDGWIYTKPFKEYQTVSYIDGFINEDNIKHAQQQSPNPYFRDKSVKYFEESITDELQKIMKSINKL